MKICVISLTYNRPEYIKRTFESLYKRAGCKFDHFVFDDGSNTDTVNVLKQLEKKYKFKLQLSKDRKNIAANFYSAMLSVPDTYDIYVKLDSDIELLSDDLFSGCLEVMSFKDVHKTKTYGVTPHVEGVFSYQRYPEDVEFYNGHVVRPHTSIAFGCSMFVTKEVYLDFCKIAHERLDTNQPFGADTVLYNIVKSFGNFVIVEDLSVYHIDNSFGQRKDFDYFTERKRWNIIDNEHVWFLRASREIGQSYISREKLFKFKEISSDFDDFLTKIKQYKVGTFDLDEAVRLQHEQLYPETITIVEDKKIIQAYEIISPSNFPASPHMARGATLYYIELPEWAKTDKNVIVSLVEIDEKTYLSQLQQ